MGRRILIYSMYYLKVTLIDLFPNPRSQRPNLQARMGRRILICSMYYLNKSNTNWFISKSKESTSKCQ